MGGLKIEWSLYMFFVWLFSWFSYLVDFKMRLETASWAIIYRYFLSVVHKADLMASEIILYVKSNDWGAKGQYTQDEHDETTNHIQCKVNNIAIIMITAIEGSNTHTVTMHIHSTLDVNFYTVFLIEWHWVYHKIPYPTITWYYTL